MSAMSLKNNYKNVRSIYIAFVKEYNAAKVNGTISLAREQEEDLNKLQELWRNASFKKDLNYFFEMKNYHSRLNFKFQDHDEDPLYVAWRTYINTFMEWRVTAMRHATMPFMNQICAE